VSQVELDIIDSSGVIQSVAAADSTLWSSSSAAINAYAQNRGYSINEYDEPPDAGTASVNITTQAQAQSWIDGVASTAVGGVAPAQTAGGFSTVELVVGLTLGGAALATALWFLLRSR
jgi:hypothetical protein